MSTARGGAYVDARCPMGCAGPTVVLRHGKLRCTYGWCPMPQAPERALKLPREHRVHFTERGFTVEHPLQCRLTGEMERCSLHQHVSGSDGPPAELGWFYANPVIRDGHPQTWEFTREQRSSL